MDRREKKTIRSIENAFLQLRAKKPLERITVKELTDLAEVSKSTFYAHYEDVYDLSEKMQKDVIREIFGDISSAEVLFLEPVQFARELLQAISKYSAITDILFSGGQEFALERYLEWGMKERIFQERPDLREDIGFNVGLSFALKGSLYTYCENHAAWGNENVLEVLFVLLESIGVK